MRYSLRILENKNLFKRHNYPSPNTLNIKYFWTISYNHWGVLSITYLSNPEDRESCMPKKHQDAALMVDRQKVFSLALFPAGIIIKFSPSRISDMLRIGFEPLESLIPGFVE